MALQGEKNQDRQAQEGAGRQLRAQAAHHPRAAQRAAGDHLRGGALGCGRAAARRSDGAVRREDGSCSRRRGQGAPRVEQPRVALPPACLD
eukprot:1247195-Prymnesium_polylepis.1